MTKTVIAIPARYGSKRFPGKPLAKIAGKEMILRVYENAMLASRSFPGVKVIAATEDERILNFCKDNDIECVLTSASCRSGTDRIVEAVDTLKLDPDFVINLQGDNPLCPPWFIADIIEAYELDKNVQVATACTQLTWEELDNLRVSKMRTPFSGTTCVMDKNMDACWFSKNIIPAIRNEDDLRTTSDYSPVYRHIGLYGYRYDVLKRYASLEQGAYEKLEGLEQLRFIENDIKVRMVIVDYKGYGSMSGVDSEEDLIRAEELFKKYGEFK